MKDLQQFSILERLTCVLFLIHEQIVQSKRLIQLFHSLTLTKQTCRHEQLQLDLDEAISDVSVIAGVICWCCDCNIVIMFVQDQHSK